MLACPAQRVSNSMLYFLLAPLPWDIQEEWVACAMRRVCQMDADGAERGARSRACLSQISVGVFS